MLSSTAPAVKPCFNKDRTHGTKTYPEPHYSHYWRRLPDYPGADGLDRPRATRFRGVRRGGHRHHRDLVRRTRQRESGSRENARAHRQAVWYERRIGVRKRNKHCRLCDRAGHQVRHHLRGQPIGVHGPIPGGRYQSLSCGANAGRRAQGHRRRRGRFACRRRRGRRFQEPQPRFNHGVVAADSQPHRSANNRRGRHYRWRHHGSRVCARRRWGADGHTNADLC